MQNSSTATLESSLAVPYKAKHAPTTQPTNPLPGIYPSEMETHLPKSPASEFLELLHSYFPQIGKCQISLNCEVVKQLCNLHTMEFYSVLKRKKLPTHGNMDESQMRCAK